MRNVRFRIFEDFKRVDEKIIAELGKLPCPIISDVPESLSFRGGGMIALYEGMEMVGSALTVRVPSGDNLMVQKAIELAKPGDIIVVEEVGDSRCALLGDLLCLHAKKKGVNGFIIDGAIRDRKDLIKLKVPIYAKNIVSGAATKVGPGEINVPIVCNGTVIYPGDVIVGDDEGYVIIPAPEAENVLEKAKKVMEEDTNKLERILNDTFDQSWIDTFLKEKGCERYPIFRR